MSEALSAVTEVSEAASETSSHVSEYSDEVEDEEGKRVSHKSLWYEICAEQDERKKAVEEEKIRQMECSDIPPSIINKFLTISRNQTQYVFCLIEI